MADGHDKEKPHFLSNEKLNWVVNTPGNSLFSVQVTMRGLVESDPKVVEDVTKRYDTLILSRLEPHFEVSDPEAINITGFAVGEKRGKVRILTSTQGIKAILPQEIGHPSVEAIESIFKFEVKCLHEEERYKLEQVEDVSPYWDAKLLYVDCRKDLLLLEADVKAKCLVHHPIITLATSDHPENKGMQIFFHGWPIYREGSVTPGRISHLGRQLKDIGCPNEYRYDMQLIEVFDGCCSKGFSGGPAINGDLDCFGVFHATYNNNGYAISWKNVAQFLNDFERTPDDHEKNDDYDDADAERVSKRQKTDDAEGAGSSGLTASEKAKGMADVENVIVEGR